MCNKEQGYYQSQLPDNYVNELLDSGRSDDIEKYLNGDWSLPAAPNHLTGRIEPLPHRYFFQGNPCPDSIFKQAFPKDVCTTASDTYRCKTCEMIKSNCECGNGIV